MKKTLLLMALLAMAIPSSSQKNARQASQQTPEWLNPQANRVNTLEARTPFFSYETEELGALGKKEKSARYMSLEGLWQFHFVRNHSEAPQGFEATSYTEDGSWVKFPVPGLFEMNGYGDPIYKNVGYAWATQADNNPPQVPDINNYTGSYRRWADIPQAWKGQQVIMHVGSATSNLRLWVNGQQVGYSEDSKVAAEFDITPYVKFGEKNLIAMQVMRWCDGTYLEDQDFWRFTGIAREVYLQARPQQHIDDIRIQASLQNNYTEGLLQIALTAPQAKGCKVDYCLYNRQEGTVFEQQGVSPQKKIEAVIKDIKPWSAEAPHIYFLRVTLRKSGKVVESFQQRVGFRNVEISNGQLLVNGQPVLIKGANRHEMSPEGGYIVSTERMMEDILAMKKMGINAVRTCHYPDDPRFYDMLDEWGFYVVAEANLESHGMGYGDRTLARVDAWKQAHLERNQHNIQTFKNHPSIIIWSLGNEAGYGPNFEAAYDLVKGYDNTRPVQYERAELAGKSDIYCPMYLNYPDCENYAKGNPSKPLIQCEYAHAMGNSEGGFKEYWQLIRKYPHYQGGFIWDFVDQGIYAHHDSNQQLQPGKDPDPKKEPLFAYGGDFGRYPATDHNFNCNGLILPDRRWNPHAYEVQYFYQNIWTTLKDSAACQLEVFNENFFEPLQGIQLHWVVGTMDHHLSAGTIDLPSIKPQERQTITISEAAEAISMQTRPMETTLTLYYLQNRLGKTDTIAHQQFVYQPGIFNNMLATNVERVLQQPAAEATLAEQTNAYTVYTTGPLSVTINRHTGLIDYLDYQGKPLLQPGTSIKPNFWRAPTDNDYGAGLQRRFAAWKEPEMKLTSLRLDNNRAEAIYNMPQLHSTLCLTYVIANGALLIKQELIASEQSKDYELPRFALQVTLPQPFKDLQWYGHGPQESYRDRYDSQSLGIWSGKVCEQYHPYVRPQESGNHYGTRHFSISEPGGPTLLVAATAPFEFSALPYEVSDLDDGPIKEAHHSHSADLTPRPYTVLQIGQQMGLGCVTSWGATPLKKYMLNINQCKQTFIFSVQQ